MIRFKFRSHASGGKESSIVATFIAGLFFFFFFALGTFFEVVIIREFGRNVVQYTWKKTSCQIARSSVTKTGTSKSPYRFIVRYSYEYNARKYTSDVYRRDNKNSKTYTDADELVRRYPEGSENACYVNPSDPAQAVLKRGSLLIGLFALLPLIFIFIGGGGLYVMITGKTKAKKKEPIAAKARSKKGKYLGFVFFLVFALAGAGMLYPLSILPIARTIDAESWMETPCKVIEGRVRSHDSDDSTTYSVYILYEYEFAGQTYKSDRYSFVGGSSSGHSGKARVVNSYKKAENPVCYVNPDSPHEAVLKRGFHPALLFSLFPLPFLAVGLGGLYFIIRGKSAWRLGSSKRWMPATVETSGEFEQVLLKSEQSPLIKFMVILFFTLLWNGIVSVLVVSVIGDIRRGDTEIGKTLLAIPFALVGLGVIALTIHQLLALFNPRPTLKLRPGRVPLGTAAELEWRLSGKTSRIGELSIKVTGREEATYRRGTKTRTDKHTFYEMELWKTSSPGDVASGRVGLVIPQDTMHSFEAANNKIIWSIDVHGDIARWPDVKESFNIVVTPVSQG